MAQFFEDEKRYPDNRPRENFIFLGYPFTPAIAADDYRTVIRSLEGEYPIRLWYFLDEITSAEMMRKIWRASLRADLAVFDVSGGNPNVAFELGLAAATNKNCFTVLKTGAANPLGAADLGYAERSEYTSAATLKEVIAKIIEAKSTAMKRISETSYLIFDSSAGPTRQELAGKTRKLLQVVYTSKRISKSQAERVYEDRRVADVALYRLRELNVLQVVGQRRGATWVFSDAWVNHDHEVAGA